MRLIIACVLIFGFLGSSLSERYTWDSPGFMFCGRKQTNVVLAVCEYKLLNAHYYPFLPDPCCKTVCTFRQMKKEYCENPKVETKYPPFTGLKNDTLWAKLMDIDYIYVPSDGKSHKTPPAHKSFFEFWQESFRNIILGKRVETGIYS